MHVLEQPCVCGHELRHHGGLSKWESRCRGEVGCMCLAFERPDDASTPSQEEDS